MYIHLNDYRVIAHNDSYLIEEAVLAPSVVNMGLWVKIPVRRVCVLWRALLLNGGMTVRFTNFQAAVAYCDELRNNHLS